mmetsp:Transcript_514/g.612  ORF Transcript_514/g.612 Transcript_514/m.612 type:complete len:338 (-) Transcript_514:1804-2817(-)|eukprot:CAMPEP_0168534902 /NCGR_PEP_ID=MMETSP0405-20121227/18283_1 /TAXON_ID=498012 /ORGANISM="Trichosphaerium sp, Strain Am-I-7 wt" /LENGTH=337 /DNA_ID=CAMNT_0008561911 /DNA_START=54 /DNA_END=1067 /DNA_ORIENTATION=-
MKKSHSKQKCPIPLNKPQSLSDDVSNLSATQLDQVNHLRLPLGESTDELDATQIDCLATPKPSLLLQSGTQMDFLTQSDGLLGGATQLDFITTQIDSLNESGAVLGATQLDVAGATQIDLKLSATQLDVSTDTPGMMATQLDVQDSDNVATKLTQPDSDSEEVTVVNTLGRLVSLQPDIDDIILEQVSRELVVGRSRTADITLSIPQISGKHCNIITKIADGKATAFIQDVSFNGTYLNGKKINGCIKLRGGDEISLVCPRTTGANLPSVAFRYERTFRQRSGLGLSRELSNEAVKPKAAKPKKVKPKVVKRKASNTLQVPKKKKMKMTKKQKENKD